MRCSKCKQPAVFNQPALCKEHFARYFEEKVRKTIKEFKLIKSNDKIIVAVSGGKDSLTVLSLLAKWYKNVHAVAIDEGIEGYREKTLVDAERVCKRLNVPLKIYSYKDLTGKTLDEILGKKKPITAATALKGERHQNGIGATKGLGPSGNVANQQSLRIANSAVAANSEKKQFHPCSVCGTLRRYLLNQAAKGADVLATGHNADDEAQVVLMNLLRGNTELFSRLGPASGHGVTGFTRRVKPLYFCTEKEVMTYAYLHNLTTIFTECPNIDESYRHQVRDLLNAMQDAPEKKQNILRQYLKLKKRIPEQKITLQRCSMCGEPASNAICKACQFVQQIKN